MTALVAAPALAAASDGDVTFYRDVLPILQDNCQTCHRAVGANSGGMVAPMSLLTYDETRPWAKSIARMAASRAMPPWFATEATRGKFHDERVLTDQQIETLTRWASTGAAAGNAADAPAAARFAQDENAGWSFRQPDLVVPLPEPYVVADDVEDLNIDFMTVLTDEQLPADAWIQGLEFRVGGRQVHHMCASAFAPGRGRVLLRSASSAATASAASRSAPAPPSCPRASPSSCRRDRASASRCTTTRSPVPGPASPTARSSGSTSRSGPVRHRAVYDAIGNVSFEIPPGNDRWRVGSAQKFEQDSYLLALWPHAHLRAVAARYELRTPDGTYRAAARRAALRPGVAGGLSLSRAQAHPRRKSPRGDAVVRELDRAGGERGFDSRQATTFGPATTDEMMIGFLNWAPAAELEPGAAAAPAAIPSSGSE